MSFGLFDCQAVLQRVASDPDDPSPPLDFSISAVLDHYGVIHVAYRNVTVDRQLGT
jgi:hypothetical protein